MLFITLFRQIPSLAGVSFSLFSFRKNFLQRIKDVRRRSQVQCHIAVLYPTEFSRQKIKQQRQNGGEHKANEDESCPIQRRDRVRIAVRRIIPTEDHSDGTEQPTGAHAGVDSRAIHFQVEYTGGERPGDCGGKRRRNPDTGIFDDSRHLKHARADSLREKPCPFVFTEADNGKAYHLRTAARNGRGSCNGKSL